jgi:hypothetical protein
MNKEMFSSKELKILETYRNPKLSGLGRAQRLSAQYLLSAGIFTYLAIAYQVWYAVAAYLIFVAFVVVRLIGARRLVGVMPEILTKYESRIAELEAEAQSRLVFDQAAKHGTGESSSQAVED